MNLQEIIVYGIIVFSVILLILRVRRTFFTNRKDTGHCTDCPIYTQCISGKEGKKKPNKKCPPNKEGNSGKSSCCK